MSRNKITMEWLEHGEGMVFTGSVRQPTFAEINNWCVENHMSLEDTYVAAVTLGEWVPPEVVRSVTLFNFDRDDCPVCHKRISDSTDICPVCKKPW